MSVRVGRIIYKDGKQIIPSYKNYTPIVILSKSSKYGVLSPFCLKDSKNRIMENIWQFAKVYKEVPKIKQPYSRYDSTVVWECPKETHVNNEEVLTEEFWKWRKTGMNCEYPIRYPVGYANKHKCIGSFLDEDSKEIQLLDYIDARKQIYFPLYCEMIKKHPDFTKLQERLIKGENLLICEIDVAYMEEINYYCEKYGVQNDGKDDDFIVNYTMSINKRNINIVLNDPKKPCGHGYGLACALLKKESWLYK